VTLLFDESLASLLTQAFIKERVNHYRGCNVWRACERICLLYFTVAVDTVISSSYIMLVFILDIQQT